MRGISRFVIAKGWLGFTITLLCLVGQLKSYGETSPDMERVLLALLNREHELVGYRVTAVETNVLFPASHPALRSDALQAHPGLREKLLEMSLAGAQTNIVSHVWSFQKDLIWMESWKSEASGVAVLNSRRAATKQEVLSSEKFMGGSVDLATVRNSASGVIQRRSEEFIPGPPFYLGRGRLSEWLRGCSGVRCSREVGPEGQNHYILNLTNLCQFGIQGADLPGRIMLRASDVIPLEFETYDSAGEVISSTQIQYGEFGNGLLLCNKAVTRYFNDNQLYKLSVLEILAVEPEMPRETPTVASFFSLGTIITDRRFSKPVSYRLGTRPPTRAEIEQMLTNRTGVPLYEAATSIHSASQRTGRKVVVVGALLLVLSIGPVLLLFINRRRS